jgi:hypothetical protein
MTKVYVLNRTPTKSVDGATPFDVWNGKKLSVQHLHAESEECSLCSQGVLNPIVRILSFEIFCTYLDEPRLLCLTGRKKLNWCKAGRNKQQRQTFSHCDAMAHWYWSHIGHLCALWLSLFHFCLFTTLQTGFLIQQHVLWVMAAHPKRAIRRKLEIEKDKSYLSLSVF